MLRIKDCFGVFENSGIQIVITGINIDQSSALKVIGTYPKVQIPDMEYGKHGERPITDENIKNVAFPLCDPIYGKIGSLIQLWD